MGVKRNVYFSIIIYLMKYCYSILSKKNEALCFWILIAITFASLKVSPIIFACLLGVLISIYEDIEGIMNKPYIAVGILLMTLLQYVLSGTYILNIFFLILIILASKVHLIGDCLSLKPFKLLGDISWGIYSFHWPLMCSIGAFLIIKLQSQLGLLTAYVISCFSVLLVTVTISVIFKFTFEKLSVYLTSIIDICIKRIARCFR